MRSPILDKREVPARPVYSSTELIAPTEEIASCTGWFDARVFQLFRGIREEGLPGGDLGGLSGEAAADEGEEGLDVWDEWGWLGD